MVITIKLFSAVSEYVPLRYEECFNITKIQFSLITLEYPTFSYNIRISEYRKIILKPVFLIQIFMLIPMKQVLFNFEHVSLSYCQKLRKLDFEMKKQKILLLYRKQNVEIKVGFQKVGTQSLHMFCCNMYVHTCSSICFKKNHCTLQH